MGNFLNNGPTILKLIVRVLSLPEHVSSPPCFGGIRVARSLVFCVVFVDRLVLFLLAIVLSALVSSYIIPGISYGETHPYFEYE
jgi:hypothetical protein